MLRSTPTHSMSLQPETKSDDVLSLQKAADADASIKKSIQLNDEELLYIIIRQLERFIEANIGYFCPITPFPSYFAGGSKEGKSFISAIAYQLREMRDELPGSISFKIEDFENEEEINNEKPLEALESTRQKLELWLKRTNHAIKLIAKNAETIPAVYENWKNFVSEIFFPDGIFSATLQGEKADAQKSLFYNLFSYNPALRFWVKDFLAVADTNTIVLGAINKTLSQTFKAGFPVNIFHNSQDTEITVTTPKDLHAASQGVARKKHKKATNEDEVISGFLAQFKIHAYNEMTRLQGISFIKSWGRDEKARKYFELLQQINILQAEFEKGEELAERFLPKIKRLIKDFVKVANTHRINSDKSTSKPASFYRLETFKHNYFNAIYAPEKKSEARKIHNKLNSYFACSSNKLDNEPENLSPLFGK